MATTVYFRDTSTNQQLVGYPPPGDPTPLIVPGSYAVPQQLIAGANSTEYVLAFADITIDAGPPNFSRPVVISNPFNLLFVTAYLWYVPASELLNNGPNPPNTYVHAYRAPDCHKFVAAKFLVAKGTVTKELTSDPVSSSSHVRTDVATTISAPPGANGTPFRCWAMSTDSVSYNHALNVPAGWAGTCLAFYG